MKLKRFVALTVTAIMAAVLLTGCSQAELTMLDAVAETAKWTAAVESGTISVEIDAERYSKMLNALADAVEDDGPADILRTVSNAAFTTLKIDVTAEVDKEKRYVSEKLNISVDDETFDVSLYIVNGNIIIGKETLDSAMRFMDKYNISNNVTYTYMEFLKAYCSDKDGLKFSANNNGYYVEYKGADDARKKLISAVSEGIKSGFKDYTSSLSSAEGGGVRFDFDYDGIVNEAGKLLLYYIGHKDAIAAAWDNAIEAYADVIGAALADGGYADVKNEMIDEVKSENIFPSVEDAAVTVEKVTNAINQNAALKELIGVAKLSYALKPDGKNAYRTKTDLTIPYDGANAIKISITGNEKNLDKIDEKVLNTTEVTDNIYEKYNEFLNMMHPVTGAEIKWKKDRFLANIHFTRQGIYYNDYEAYGTHLLETDDRIYVPMRVLAEGLGYEVEWDNENERAYVWDGENKIDMTGRLLGDTTYIKVRDFEKLGLSVSYEENMDGMCIASVIKAVVPR